MYASRVENRYDARDEHAAAKNKKLKQGHILTRR
jgi:hypothetical protein